VPLWPQHRTATELIVHFARSVRHRPSPKLPTSKLSNALYEEECTRYVFLRGVGEHYAHVMHMQIHRLRDIIGYHVIYDCSYWPTIFSPQKSVSDAVRSAISATAGFLVIFEI